MVPVKLARLPDKTVGVKTTGELDSGDGIHVLHHTQRLRSWKWVLHL